MGCDLTPYRCMSLTAASAGGSDLQFSQRSMADRGPLVGNQTSCRRGGVGDRDDGPVDGVKGWHLDGLGVQVAGVAQAAGGPGVWRCALHVGHRRTLGSEPLSPPRPRFPDVGPVRLGVVPAGVAKFQGTIPTMYSHMYRSGRACRSTLLLLLFTGGQIRRIASMWPMSCLTARPSPRCCGLPHRRRACRPEKGRARPAVQDGWSYPGHLMQTLRRARG